MNTYNSRYSLDVLHMQKAKLQALIGQAKYDDQIKFYNQCLAEVLKDIENIGNTTQNNANNDRFCMSIGIKLNNNKG